MATALPAIIFAGVLLVCVIVGLAIAGGGTAAQVRKRAERVAKAAEGLAVPPVAAAGATATIRRGQGGGIKAMERLAARLLPRQSVLRERLARTGRDISLGTYLMVNVALGAVAFVVAWVLIGLPPTLSGLAGFIAGVAVPHIGVGVMAKRRRKRFVAILPDAIDLMVRGLRSGLPIGESMAAAGREMPDPVGEEFRRIMDSVRFGRDLHEVLWQTAKRLDTAEFNFFVISLSIQQETGGNLAETLANLSEIIRRRRQMRLKIKALSGEARASAMILGSLPFVMFAIVYMMNQGYAGQLFSDPRGLMMTAAGVGSMLVGIAVMAKMVRFEI